MTDVVTPDFRKRMKAGEIINNPCSYSRVLSESLSPGHYTIRQNSTGNVQTRNFDFQGNVSDHERQNVPTQGPTKPTYVISASAIAELVRSAESAAMANIDKAPYELMEDAFQWRQTLTFLRDPLKELRELVELYQRGAVKNVLTYDQRRRAKRNFKRTAEDDRYDHYKAVVNAWLKYRFAFNPLLQTVENAVNGFLTKTRRPPRETARGFASIDKKVRNTQVISSLKHWDIDYYREVKVRSGVLYTHSNPVADWKYEYGLRVKDVPETLWALVPYSFMVDRVFNISDFIRGMTNSVDPNITALAGWTTTTSEETFKWYLSKYGASGWTTLGLSPGVMKTTTYTYTRVPFNPSFFKTLPGFLPGNLLSDSARIADLLSLVAQPLIGGKARRVKTI